MFSLIIFPPAMKRAMAPRPQADAAARAPANRPSNEEKALAVATKLAQVGSG